MTSQYSFDNEPTSAEATRPRGNADEPLPGNVPGGAPESMPGRSVFGGMPGYPAGGGGLAPGDPFGGAAPAATPFPTDPFGPKPTPQEPMPDRPRSSTGIHSFDQLQNDPAAARKNWDAPVKKPSAGAMDGMGNEDWANQPMRGAGSGAGAGGGSANSMHRPEPAAPSEPLPGPPPGRNPPATPAENPLGDWKPFGPGLSQTFKVGRSIKSNPERRLEMAEREAMAAGDYKAAAQIASQRLGLQQRPQDMDFARERDATNFDQQKEMFDLQKQAQQTRDAEHAQRQNEMWQRDQGAHHNDEDVQWERQREMFGLHTHAEVMREEREQQRREQERNRAVNVGFTPIPGSDYGIPTADGRPMGTLPQHQDKPQGQTHEEIAQHIQDMADRGVKAQQGKNGWTYEPQEKKVETVKVVNDQGKVVDFPAEYEVPAGWKALQKKGAGGPAAPAPAANSGGTTKPSSFLNF